MMVYPVEPRGRSVGIFVRDEFVKAGSRGLVAADLFKDFKERRITRATYNSFDKYIYFFRKLGLIEPTGRTEPAEVPELKERVYYRISAEGRRCNEEWYNPLRHLYPDWWERSHPFSSRPRGRPPKRE